MTVGVVVHVAVLANCTCKVCPTAPIERLLVHWQKGPATIITTCHGAEVPSRLRFVKLQCKTAAQQCVHTVVFCRGGFGVAAGAAVS